MGNHSKVLAYFFLLRLALLIQYSVGFATSNQVATTAAQVRSSNYDDLNLSNRMLEIEAKSRHQESEIALLKTLRIEDKNEINKLRDRVEQLEGSLTKTSGHGTILERQKRPFRLMPANFQRGKEGNLNDDRQINGPATSCEELGKNGYTLNGYYIVKGKSQPSSDSNKIEVVYCQFYQPYNRVTENAMENRLGFLNIMNKSTVSGIYFYVQRQGKLPNAPNGVIRFTKERLNIGGAMNISTGVFTAPKAGINQFSFSLVKEGYSIESLRIYIRVNGNQIGMSAVGAAVTGAPATLQLILKLKKGDRVDLWKDNSYGTLEYFTGEMCHHFSGWLLSEEGSE